MIRPIRLLQILILLASSATVASAQTGTPPFGSFGGGPDIINLANLNSHLTIPVMNKSGRGTNFTYDLDYDTSVWFPAGASGAQSWQPMSNWGWLAQTAGATGYITYTARAYQCLLDPGPPRQYGTRYEYTHWAYTDFLGKTHGFGLFAVEDNDCGQTTSGSATATDGSGYVISAYGSGPSASVYSSSGALIDAPLLTTSGAAVYTDRNGNQLSVDTSGHFTDTLGTTALTISGAGTPASPTLMTYTAPSGANASYTMRYAAYTVQTAFGCSGISEYGPTSNNLVSEIDLPDGSKYTFAYEQTPGVPANVTGRLASITLPTGGTISYTYTGGNNGITCADGSTSGLQRYTPDTGSNYWNYARTPGSGAAYTTTVTDPQGNNTVIQFQGIYETQRQVYQGAISPSNLLKTTTVCYNGNTTNCTSTVFAAPISQRNVTVQLPGASNLTAQHVYYYGASGSITEQDDYDYGSGAVGPLLKKTTLTYASLGNNITKYRQQVSVTDGSGSTVSKTNYNYDETAVVATSGTPQHTSVTGSRGNLTSINYYTNGTNFLTKKFSYFDTGNVQTVTDLNNAQTTYAYGACGNSFPTSVSEPLSLSSSMTWNCTGGVQTSTTDENNQVTSVAYNTDPYFWRPQSVTDPTNAVANLTYLSPTQGEGAVTFNGGSSAADALGSLDGMGRPSLTQKRQSPGSANFDTVETDYDSLGRPSRVTLPYSGTSGQTNPSAPGKTTTYDALSRTLSVTNSGGGTQTFTYPQNDVTFTLGPAPSGENAKRRQHEYDALDRLTSVCEMTSLSGSGSCAQTNSQTGYWTKYSYDSLGHVTGVTQNAQASGSTQSRSYVYDFMGRLTSETNAESGTTTYTYDTDATCGTSNGDLVKKVDAVGNVICTAYDALHRPTQITYPSGPYVSVTPTKNFVYDSATVNGVAMTYAKTRMAEAYTCFSPCSTKITDEGFSYTVRGEPSDVYESTANSGGYYHVSAQYWANSGLKQLSSLTGLPTITYTPDGEGRSYQVSDSSPQNLVTNTVFNSASLPTSVTFGSGDSDSFSYDSTTNRMTQYQFTLNGQSLVGVLTWNANHTLQTLQITDPFNSADTQTCTFSYDDLKRLSSDNCGSTWSQTFSYDAFGNITKSGSMSFQPTYSSSTNRFSTLPGFTPSYDANGNVLADGSHTYAWNVHGRPATIDGVTVTYDALDRMVERNNSGSISQVVYAPSGSKLALMSGQSLLFAFVPLPGGVVAEYHGGGVFYYRHPDWLGSARLISTTGRTMYADTAYAPFGEPYAQAGTADISFTGQNADTVYTDYDFLYREYSIQGRWPSPDPSGLASVHWRDPQSLNRYAYSLNNPLALIDAFGTDEDCSDHCPELDGGDGGSSGGGDGGAGGDPASGGDPSNGGDPSSGGDPGNGGNNCSATSQSCGGSQGGNQGGSPDDQGCDLRVDPTCGGRVNMDPCTNPESAQCANPQDYAQGYGPWGITGADDPCYFTKKDGATWTATPDTSIADPKKCRDAGGQWVPPGWDGRLNPNGSITLIPPGPTGFDALHAAGMMAGNYLSCTWDAAVGGAKKGAVIGGILGSIGNGPGVLVGAGSGVVLGFVGGGGWAASFTCHF